MLKLILEIGQIKCSKILKDAFGFPKINTKIKITMLILLSLIEEVFIKMYMVLLKSIQNINLDQIFV
jgi:hypothetical protein